MIMKKILVLLLLTLFALSVSAEEPSKLEKAKEAVKKGEDAAGRGIEKGEEVVGSGLKKGGQFVGKHIEKAGNWVGSKVNKDGKKAEKAGE
jgi:uncharacterized membrane-anchored protein YjiN (DUF445 family)